jgi:hypothetical protein
MKLEVQQALSFFKEDKNWMTKLSAYVAGMILLLAVSSAMNVMQYLPVETFDEVDFSDVSVAYTAFTVFAAFILFIVSFVYSIYQHGYKVELIQNMMGKSETPLPEVGNLQTKLKLFGAKFIINLVPALISGTIFTVIILVIVFSIIYAVEGGNDLSILVIVLLSILGIIFFILLAIVLPIFISILTNAMLFVYLSTNDIGSAFNYLLVKTVMKAAWKKFLIIGLLSIAFNIAAQLASLVGMMCLMGWLVGGLAQSWQTIGITHMYGQIFTQLKENKILG